MNNEQLNTPNDKVAEERRPAFLQPAVWISLLLVIGTLIYCSFNLLIPNLADLDLSALDSAALMLIQWLKIVVYVPLVLLLLIFVVERKKKTLARSMLIFALISSVLMVGLTFYFAHTLTPSQSSEGTLFSQEIVPAAAHQSSGCLLSSIASP